MPPFEQITHRTRTLLCSERRSTSVTSVRRKSMRGQKKKKIFQPFTTANMFSFLSFSLAFLLCKNGNTASVGSVGSDESVLSGVLYVLEPLNGLVKYRLNRRHLAAMNSSGVHHLRLHLGPEVRALDMEVRQDSVWKEDSRVVIRRGEETEDFQGMVDPRCFLSGRLTSREGVATLNRCGRLTGLIHAGACIYEYEEPESSDLDDPELPNVKVIIKGAKDQDIAKSEILADDLKGFNVEETKIIHRILKRKADSPIAEVAVVIDSGFADFMSTSMRKTTPDALTDWVVKKWNLIRNVYGNKEVTGMSFDIQLKKVEIWQTNPEYYERLGQSVSTLTLLMAFCNRSNKGPFDHFMLYTMREGHHHQMMGFFNNICKENKKCALVESTTMNIRRELHVLGHNLGLHHDAQLMPCTNHPGFMGYHAPSIGFLDCYRRRLLETLGKLRLPTTGSKFLFEDPVDGSHKLLNEEKKCESLNRFHEKKRKCLSAHRQTDIK